MYAKKEAEQQMAENDQNEVWKKVVSWLRHT